MFEYKIELEESSKKLNGATSLHGLHYGWQQKIESPVQRTPKLLLEDIFFPMVPFTASQVADRIISIIWVEKQNPQNIVLNVKGKVKDVILQDTL